VIFREVGRVVVLVDDQDAALAFYGEVLGFETLHDEASGGLRYLHIGLPGPRPVGIWLMPALGDDERRLVGRQAGEQPLLVLYSDDLDAVRARLAAHDVATWAERDDETGRSLHFRDVAGNVLVAVQLRA
jgi:catechol 2,3-dioxygenase-like lactoylglutathione lyase family enzyme